jgi:hypothetical protein
MVMFKHSQEFNELIDRYVTGELDGADQIKISQLRNDGLWDDLFDLIDAYKRGRRFRMKKYNKSTGSIFDEADDLISDFLSGNLSKSSRKKFMYLLVHSNIFRNILFKYVAEPGGRTDMDQELAELNILSDKMILERLKRQSFKEKARGREDYDSALKEKRVNVLGRLSPAKPAFLYVLFTFFLIIIILVVFIKFNKSGINECDAFCQYFDQTQPPYPIDSYLRGISVEDALPGNMISQTLRNDFEKTMGRYMDQDYDDAIYLFREMEPRIVRINPKNCTLKEKEFLQDFYFYYAASQLARLNEKKGDKNVHPEVIDSAIANLRRAEELTVAQHNKDRETFFLGLAYGLAGDITAAERQLALVQTDVGLKEKARIILYQLQHKAHTF